MRDCIAVAPVRFALSLALFFLEALALRAAEPRVDFNRDIRPVFSDTCFKCHGFDKNTREAELRLDTREGAFEKRDEGTPIVPGNAAKSLIMKRLLSKDPEVQMPPPKSGLTVTPAQAELVRRWIEEGAEYQSHWAFIPPKAAPQPAVKNAAWPKNAIDHFVLARLEREGLAPAPEAEKGALLRRLTLDLTGLPPTLAELDAFLADTSPEAYEKAVDRLLATPQYGERMALEWLDAARFADTHGYHIDSGRDMTVWREWVIGAFNKNLPFDRFTIEQLAGDLLPGATLEQKIASGFHRNTMLNFEGGAIPEEYHTQYVIDRVNTTGTVWLGLTIGCSQCHDHKYDPITQKDYYSLYAFFNNVPENGLDGSKGNAVPFIKVPKYGKQDVQIAVGLARYEEQLAAAAPAADAAQAKWEAERTKDDMQWETLAATEMTAAGGAKFEKQADQSLFVSGENPAQDTYTLKYSGSFAGIAALRIEALPDDRLNGKGPGRSVNGNIVMTSVAVKIAGEAQKVSKVTADFSQDGYPVVNLVDGKDNSGWAIFPQAGVPHIAVLDFEKPLSKNYEGKPLEVVLEFKSPHERHQLGRFRISATRSTNLGARTDPALAAALAVPREKRSAEQAARVRDYFRTKLWADTREIAEKVAELNRRAAELDKTMATTMVMEEKPGLRQTHILMRGAYDKKGDKVSAAVPASLPPLPAGAQSNRLGLAEWLVSPAQPLTARVTVNRYWQMYFGLGLVKTSEDFGSQGAQPSHPELLDHLAVTFRESGWNVKQMQKLMVMSATYRQSSAAPKELFARDPENRLLARGARQRLKAEFIRDQALAVSGLLNKTIGGKSVSPYQPPGIWEELAYRADFKNWTAQVYEQSHGPDLYRRSMYTFWKRTAPPAQLVTFDAPDRETCTVRRATTNTPLQALVLMNDPTYVESARKLAERCLAEGGDTFEERARFGFRLVTARSPRATEAAVLARIYEAELAHFKADDAATAKLLSVGESPRHEKLSPAEHAAFTMVATTLLNLDETVTKP